MIADDRLDEVLASVGELLLTDGAAETARTPTRRRFVAVACAAAATIVVATPLRTAVAGWLGIGSTRVEIRPSDSSVPVSLPSIQTGLRMIDRAEAERVLDAQLPVLDASALGAPAGFAAMPEGGVLVVWPDATTLWIHAAGSESEVLLDKLIASVEQVEPIDGLGDDAIAVVGDHVLQTPHRTVAAGTTVLWVDGSQELRLGSDRPVADLIGIARELAMGG